MNTKVIILLSIGVVIGCSTTNVEQNNNRAKPKEMVGPIAENDHEYFTRNMYFNSEIEDLVPVTLKIPVYPDDAYKANIQGSCDVSFNLVPRSPKNVPSMKLYGTSNIAVTNCRPSGYFEESCAAAASEWYFEYRTLDQTDISESIVQSVCTYKVPADSVKEDSDIAKVLAPSEIGKFKNSNAAPPPFLSVDQFLRYEMESEGFLVGVDILVYRRPGFVLGNEINHMKYSISSAYPDSTHLAEEDFDLKAGNNHYEGFHLQTKSVKNFEEYVFTLITDSYVFDLEGSYVSLRFTTFADVRDSVEEDITHFVETILKNVTRS